MNETLKKYRDYIIYIGIIVLVILLKIYFVTPIKVNGSSMDPTLKNKDIMLLNKIVYKTSDIRRFDIVVIELDDEYIIKRVIGLPGEKVEYKNNKLYINGKYIKEKFSHKKTADFSLDNLSSTTVPDNQYFVLGDNRTNSADSRIIGFIPKEKISGRSRITILPFNRIGRKK